MKSEKEILLSNLNKIHTTSMGIVRIKRNIKLEDDIDVVEFCKGIIAMEKAIVSKNGKNYYVTFGEVTLTINSYSYTVITAKITNKMIENI